MATEAGEPRWRRTLRRHRLATEVLAALAAKLLALFVLYQLFFDEDSRPQVDRADIYGGPAAERD